MVAPPAGTTATPARRQTANAVMQSNQITRCPDCRTLFQVTRAQLEAAQGSVRCGSCLHTFDARACLVVTGSDRMLAEPGAQAEQSVGSEPGAQSYNDPEQGPEILSVYAELDEIEPASTKGEPAPEPPARARPRVQIPDEIAHGALELEAGKTSTLPGLLGWAGLNLILLLTLVAQFGYLYFDSWRVHAWTGPWIERGCAHLTCPAPRRNDLDLLVTRDLRVRSHPELPEVLVVELNVLNQAPFSQPLPVLEIRFIDVIGSPVESRRIPPTGYMPGYDAASDFLPAHSSAQILLETPDPGDHAANYTLRLHAASGA